MHRANPDLAVSLMHRLAAVESGDIDVARFFVLCPRRTRPERRLLTEPAVDV